MATHILWEADVADFDAWLSVFYDDFPSREASGIRELFIWRDPERSDRAIALFEVLDIDRARAFFDSEELAMHRERDGVAHVSLKLLAAP